MTKYITGMAIVAILGVGAMYIPSTTVITNPESIKEIVEIEKTVPEIDKRYEEAIAASSTEIERIVQEESKKVEEKIKAEIRLRVNRQMQEELELEESKLEEQVSL